MSRSVWRRVLIIALRLVITFLFAPAILAKLRHPDVWAQLFITWGYPAWGVIAVSCAEIIALLTLWMPRLAVAAKGVLVVTLTGATGTWLAHGPRETATYPATILILVISLSWLEGRVERSPR